MHKKDASQIKSKRTQVGRGTGENQRGSSIFTGAVFKMLASNGAILAESGAHQVPFVWFFLWGYFKLKGISEVHCGTNLSFIFTSLRLQHTNKGILCSLEIGITFSKLFPLFYWFKLIRYFRLDSHFSLKCWSLFLSYCFFLFVVPLTLCIECLSVLSSAFFLFLHPLTNQTFHPANYTRAHLKSFSNPASTCSCQLDVVTLHLDP